MKYFDFHTHLNDPKLFFDWKQYLQDFISIWGKWLINIWVDDSWNKRAILIAEEVKNYRDFIWTKVLASIWYHPSEVCFRYTKDLSDDWFTLLDNFDLTGFRWWSEDKWMFQKIEKLKNLYLDHKDVVVWIGECWIDVHYPNWKKTIDLQKHFFDLQCQLAQELKLPIIIHSREDFNSTFDIVKNYKNLKIYFHCWWYWPEEIKKLLDYFPNIWIGFAWNLTYPKANNLRQSLKIVPLDNLVLETDAPYLTPQKVRWKTNKPSYIRYTYDFVASYLNIDIQVLSDKMEENFKRLYLV